MNTPKTQANKRTNALSAAYIILTRIELSSVLIGADKTKAAIWKLLSMPLRAANRNSKQYLL